MLDFDHFLPSLGVMRMTRLQTFENAAHVMDELISFHEELSEQYSGLAESSTIPLSRLLLQFLADREKKQADSLESFEANAPYKVLKTWIQVPFPADPESFIGSLQQEFSNDLEPDQVYELGNKADEFIVGLLEHLQDRCEIEDIKTLFGDLLKGERDNNIALSKAFNSLREF